MPTSTIISDNGVLSGTTGLKTAGGDDGTLVLQTTTAGGTATTAVTINTSQAVTFAQTANLPNTFGFKNRLINGAMVIDQRNAGASLTINTTQPYTLDRWVAFASVTSKYSVQQNAGAVTPPAGFKNYLGVTSLATTSLGAGDYYFVCQKIEGYNCADLGFGAAGASTVTVSFWVRSSLTGTFGGALNNGDSTRAYPFTYTISVANTWEQKSVTIAGDTSGTWDSTNGKSIIVIFGLGVGSSSVGTAGSWSSNAYFSATGATSVVGTNGATFYITGVQLEKGSTATSFDYRDYGRELALCQRYYYRTTPTSVGRIAMAASGVTNSTGRAVIPFPVPMRTSPSALEQSGTAGDYSIFFLTTATACTSVPTFSTGTPQAAEIVWTATSGHTAGNAGTFYSTGTAGYLGWSAEL
jgi:hypothetical protein